MRPFLKVVCTLKQSIIQNYHNKRKSKTDTRLNRKMFPK